MREERGEEEEGEVEVVVEARGNLAPHQHQGSMHFRPQKHGGLGTGEAGAGPHAEGPAY